MLPASADGRGRAPAAIGCLRQAASPAPSSARAFPATAEEDESTCTPRKYTALRTAASAMTIAAPSAAWFSPRVNAVRAASSKPFPSGPGSRPAR